MSKMPHFISQGTFVQIQAALSFNSDYTFAREKVGESIRVGKACGSEIPARIRDETVRASKQQ